MQGTQIRKDMAQYSLTWASDVSAWLDSHPSALPPGTDGRYPLNRKLDGPALCLDAFEKKNSLLYTENRTTIHFLSFLHASHSLDCASRALSSGIQ